MVLIITDGTFKCHILDVSRTMESVDVYLVKLLITQP